MTAAEAFGDLLARFPNAYPHHGFEGVDIPWTDDADIIVTLDGEVAIGIYLAGRWHEGEEPNAMVIVDTPEHAVMFVDDITDLTPEGVDWGAWVVQWIADASADRRIEGEHRPWDAEDPDPERVTGAVLAQLEDLDRDAALAVLADAMETVRDGWHA